MSKLITIIMAGGKGERLWPKSDSQTPKQFASITSEKTMLEETLKRVQLFSKKEDIYISLLKESLPLVKKIIPNFPQKNLILEPIVRDTACAILLATLAIPADADDILVFMPADHYLNRLTKFRNDILKAFRLTKKTKRATLIGIPPSFPSTEYGYLNTEKKPKEKNILTVKKFVEKPNLDKAKAYFQKKNYLWNSGIFIFNKNYLLELFRHLTPKLFKEVTSYLSLLQSKRSKQALQLYEKIEKISFDYAIAEKASQIDCIPSSFFWDDVGNWEALFRIKTSDSQGNIVMSPKNYHLRDAHGNLCLIEDDKFLVLNGVEKLIIVSKKDKIYIAHRNSAHQIKSILEELQNEKKRKKN